ncbi:IclR family transcriptional regulator [Rhabdonatronobacter sediminivivens]|uniref:IclR family transcriptional regulator n=1 Tax=Rhabdonatronobacter sediminivivens TaxID=2743469 RepID=UPI0022867161|nr:IclR family transcriptional regulator C-terminal domain-containing protein [Rhabdonatronobacter sediminivivens]
MTLILEIVGQKGAATLADICTHSDLPKPSAYRLAQDLVGAGLLEPVARGRFAIGNRLKRITRSEQSDRALLEIIAPALKQAATRHGAVFFLSRLRGRAVEIIHVETPESGVSYLHPGLGKRPLHACSCSKAVAAFSSNLRATGALEGRLKAFTEFTLTRVEDLEAELQVIRQRGYAECVEEIDRGMCSVAAPLGETGFGATMSIGAAGSTRVFSPAFRARMGQEIIALTRAVAASLGGLDLDEPARPGQARQGDTWAPMPQAR